jgi:hypothetical protein
MLSRLERVPLPFGPPSFRYCESTLPFSEPSKSHCHDSKPACNETACDQPLAFAFKPPSRPYEPASLSSFESPGTRSLCRQSIVTRSLRVNLLLIRATSSLPMMILIV